MKNINMTKITALILSLVIFCSLTAGAYAKESGDADNSIKITNAGGIAFYGISANNDEITVKGRYSGARADIITYLVYEKNNPGNLITIGETRSKDTLFEFVFGIDRQTVPENLVVEIKSERNSEKAIAEFSINDETLSLNLAEKIAEVKSLIDACEEKGIATDYERVKYATAVQVYEMINTYLSNGESEAYEFNTQKASELLGEAKAKLEAYIAGTETPLKVNRTVTSKPKVDGKSFVSTMDDGSVKPAFYVGYGHWNADDMEQYKDLGVNYIHYEVGVSDVLKRPNTSEGGKFVVDNSAIARIKDVFSRAEKADVSVVLLLAMHNFPDFVYEYDETAKCDKEWDWSFIQFNPTHPLIKETLTAFIDAVIPAVKDYKSLNSVCLSNEPIFAANKNTTYYQPIYQKYIKDKYTTIDKVNEAYGTSYTSFSELVMPTGERKSADSGKVTCYNDYREFNDSIMTEYHKTLADAVKAIDSSLLLHTKQMTPMGAYGTSNNRVENGVNHEKLSQFLDVNGCDAYAYYGNEQYPLMSKTMWYDYLTSVKNAPVVNSEDHILKDVSGDNSVQVRRDNEFKMNMADIWQGAIHGRGATAIWFWDKSQWTGKGTYYYNTNLTRRADYIAEIGKITLDLNRLSGEITAIQQAKPRVGILYSDNSMSQIPYALEATYKAYSKVLTGGEKVFFVTEEQPELLNTTEGLELLIVPCSSYMKAETLTQIKRFIDGGGKVLMLRANNREWLTENGKTHDAALLNSVVSASEAAEFTATSSSRVEDTNGAVNAKIDEMLNQLTVKDVTLTVKNGEVEWAEASYGIKRVINICNHGTVPVQVTLNVPSEYNAAETVDLISKDKVGGSFTVQPNEPMLLSIQGDSVTKFLNTNGETVNYISDNKMSASVLYYGEEPEESVTHIVAVYENGCLKKLFTNPVQTGVAGTAKSEIEFDIDSNIDLTKCTVKSFLFNSFEDIKPLLPAKEISRQ